MQTDNEKVPNGPSNSNTSRYEFLAAVVESLHDSVVTIDLDGTITTWNPSAEALYGYPASEAIGKPLSLVTVGKDFRELLETVERIRRDHVPVLYDTIRIHKDGHDLHLEITLSPVKDSAGAVIGTSTIARDVSELRAAQAALKASEGELRALIEAAVDFGIMTINGRGIILDWNSGAEAMFGYTREEVVGQHTEILFTPEDRHAGIPLREIETARKEGRSLDERWHLHKDGSRFFVSGVMTPTANDDPERYVKIARNITDRKLAEEALLVAEQRKSLAVESAAMGEWEWDLATGSVHISEQVCALVGVAPTESVMSTNRLLRFLFPDDAPVVREQVTQAIEGLNILQAECRIVRADNQQIKWVNIYGRVVAHSGEAASKMIGVLYDITPRKLLEKHKDDFISLASHELKTPITAIKAYTDILEENFQEANESENLRLLGKMNGQVNRLIRLVQNLLDSSHVSEGKVRIHAQTLDINEVAEEAIDMLKAVTSRHQVSWKPSPIPLVHADRERLVQVISNFVTNAVKYSPEETEIVIATEDQLHQVLLTVTDQGMGIPLEAQQFVFERYYRGEHAPGNKGFGLGLYICSEIIKQHHGTIGLRSVPGEGSTFYFTLPYS